MTSRAAAASEAASVTGAPVINATASTEKNEKMTTRKRRASLTKIKINSARAKRERKTNRLRTTLHHLPPKNYRVPMT